MRKLLSLTLMFLVVLQVAAKARQLRGD